MRRAFLAGLLLVGGCAVHHRDVIGSLSDLHLGDPRSVVDDEEGRQALMEIIRGAVQTGGMTTLVLDGDTFELSLASPEASLGEAGPFFAELASIEGLKRVVLIPGNHDHRIFEAIPGELTDKLGKGFEEGTPFHQALGGVLGKLRLTVVYPDWGVTLDDGQTVHFTHGHYFDPWTTPTFDAKASFAEVELANAPWLSVVTAGGADPEIRGVYRFLYHWSQHLHRILHPPALLYDPAVHWSKREEDRVLAYLKLLGDPKVGIICAGHTHDCGGMVEEVPWEGRVVLLYDTGAFVASHDGLSPRPYLFLLDPHRDETALVPLELPAGALERAHQRAFEVAP